jgi:hypothetical protein
LGDPHASSVGRPPPAESPAPRSRARALVVFAAKAVVATVLITWLVRGGSLEMGKLAILIERPSLLAFDLAVFAAQVVLGTLRYGALLTLAGVTAPFARLLQLQLTAVFFNAVVPGNIGGDVIKALYVARGAPASRRTTILLIVFVERLLGLAGLVVLAALVAGVNGPRLLESPLLRPLASVVLLLGAGLVGGAVAFVLVMRRAGARLDAWTSGPSKVAKLLNQLVAAMRLLTSGPRSLALALAFSMAMHALGMALFTSLTEAITGQDVPYSSVASVFPLGVLTMILPISPAGVGVGHVAFDRLFSAIGLSGGANVFNVFLIGQIAPGLLGVFPYLALKRSGDLPRTGGEGEETA